MKSGYTVTEMSLSFAILYTRVYHDAVESAAKIRNTLRVYHDAVESAAKNKEMGEVAWRY